MNDWTWNLDVDEEEYLAHHGVLGMKWGIRRYQNYDGSLTAAGRKRLGQVEKKIVKNAPKAAKQMGVDINLNDPKIKYATSKARSNARTAIKNGALSKKSLDSSVNFIKQNKSGYKNAIKTTVKDTIADERKNHTIKNTLNDPDTQDFMKHPKKYAKQLRDDYYSELGDKKSYTEQAIKAAGVAAKQVGGYQRMSMKVAKASLKNPSSARKFVQNGTAKSIKEGMSKEYRNQLANALSKSINRKGFKFDDVKVDENFFKDRENLTRKEIWNNPDDFAVYYMLASNSNNYNRY